MKMYKRALSLFVALALMAGIIPISVFSASATDYPSIQLGEEKLVTLSERESMYYSFTPDEDGYYAFYSYDNDADTYGYILDSDMEVIASDDDGGYDANFRVKCWLESGVTYVLNSTFYSSSSSGSFSVCVERVLGVADMKLVSMPYRTEYIGGYIDIDYSGLELELTWSDGSTTNWAYYDSWYAGDSYISRDSSYVNETGEVVLTCDNASITLQFTLIEDPVSHIELVSGTSYTYIENYNGYWDENEEGEYFYYHIFIPYDAVIRIVYKDGTSVTANVGDEVDGYYIRCSSDQYSEPWVVGTDNKSTISYLGHTVNLPITVIEDPVSYIELVSGTSYTYLENHDGWMEENENGEYFYYQTYTPDDAVIRIVYKDGTSVTANVDDEVDGYYIYWYTNQYDEPWVVGTDNKMIITYLGHEVELPISVLSIGDYPSIQLGEEKLVTLFEGGEMFYLFTPDEDGYYAFYSYDNDADTYGYILDSDMEVIASDDDGGYDANFRVKCWLESGVTYVLNSTFYSSSSSGSFSVCVERVLGVADMKLVSMPYRTEYIGGYIDIDYSGLELELTWSDGSTTNWAYYDSWYADDSYISRDSSYVNETGEVVLTCDNASITLQFTLIEDPVSYIELVSGTERTYIENYNGWLEENEDGEFFYYDTHTPNDAVIRIVYKDGTSVTANVNDEVDGYHIGWSSDQYSEPWVVGTDNKSIIYYRDFEVILPITVIEDPVSHIELVSGTEYTYLENYNGYWSENDDGEFFRYYVNTPYDAVIRIVYKDGTSVTANVDDYVDGYYIDWYTNQYDEPWVVGTDNKSTISYLGHTVNLPIAVIEDPVSHIELVSGTSYNYVENVNGYWSENDDGEFFCYDTYTPSDAVIRIVYKDGTSVTANVGDEVDGYYISWDHNQYDEPWVVGTDNKSTISYLGHEVNLPITVKENMVLSIEIISGRVTCIENTYGYETDNGYRYYYDLPEEVLVRINYKDGTSKTVNARDEIDGYWFNFSSDQGENPWVLGDDNYMTVSYLNAETQLPVSVIPNPVERIEINSAPTREYVYGDAEFGYLYPDGSYEFYPTDLRGLSFTVYYTDGTTKTYSYDDIVFEYGIGYTIDGYTYELSFGEGDPQIGDFPVQFEYLGRTAEYTVKLKESPVESIAITKLPKNLIYEYYYEPDFLGMEITITYKDGTTKTVVFTEDNLIYDYIAQRGQEIWYEVLVDGYTLEIGLHYDEDFVRYYVAEYLGAQCDIHDIIYTEGKEIDSVKLDNVTSDGDGMKVTVKYTDGTSETLTIETIAVDEWEMGVEAYGKTKKGLLYYAIECVFDENEKIVGYDVYILGKWRYYEVPKYQRGDVNGDGKVNVFDYAAVKAHCLGRQSLDSDKQSRADLTGDGKINVFDYAALKALVIKG